MKTFVIKPKKGSQIGVAIVKAKSESSLRKKLGMVQFIVSIKEVKK